MSAAMALPAPVRWLATGGEKSHPATQHRKEQAKRKGQGWHSPDFQAAVGLLTAFVILRIELQGLGGGLAHMMAGMLAAPLLPDFRLNLANLLGVVGRALLLSIVPVVVPLGLLGIAIGLLQNGFRVSTAKLAPDWTRLNPAQGLARIFSRQTLWALVKGLLKMGLIGAAAAWVIGGQLAAYPAMLTVPLGVSLKEAAAMVAALFLWTGGAYLGIAVLDMGWQYYSYQQSLRMSTQDLRDEVKDTEGDPRLRGRRREIRRKWARTGLGQVRSAQVVIANPTHYAVALAWDERTMPAPTVVAKGVDDMAWTIRRLAAEHDVPVVENPPLARSLFEVPVGTTIREEHYQLVADILAVIISRRPDRGSAHSGRR